MREAEQIVSMCSACHVAARPAGQEVVDLERQQLHLCPAFCRMACRASGGGLHPVPSFCCCTHFTDHHNSGTAQESTLSGLSR